MAKQDSRVWLITGCSTGFGRELAKAVLERGDRAIVTARRTETVRDLVEGRKGQAIALRLDVTNQESMRYSVVVGADTFGRIDVLVNNAGIGYFGSIEESDENEVRRMFEINFWGLTQMTRTVLPMMRARRSGHIVNIASIGGLRAFPALGYYNASKFEVVGFSEALALETAPLGIRVTIVEPSGFRTDWAGRSAAEASTQIADYAATAAKNLASLRGNSGRQPGDPARAAAAIIQAVESDQPPPHLLLGRAALRGARQKVESMTRDFDAWAQVTEGADFPAA